MEVPREQRRCSFEVRLVYCWPFCFNLYHQRAWLNYGQLHLFSWRHRTRKTEAAAFSLLSFSPLFLFGCSLSFLHLFVYPHSRPTSVNQEISLERGSCRVAMKPLFWSAQQTSGWRTTSLPNVSACHLKPMISLHHPRPRARPRGGSTSLLRPSCMPQIHYHWLTSLTMERFWYYFSPLTPTMCATSLWCPAEPHALSSYPEAGGWEEF